MDVKNHLGAEAIFEALLFAYLQAHLIFFSFRACVDCTLFSTNSRYILFDFMRRSIIMDLNIIT